MKTEVMKEFKRTNIAIAILLNIITFDFYSIYWLGEQRKFLNSKTPSNQTPITFVIACYILLILLWFFSHGVWFLYFAVKLLLLFEIRNKIHSVSQIKQHDNHWMNAAYLFIFGFLYLIYKLDDFPANKKTPEKQESPARFK
ncbi:MAG: hypothetical protein K0T99_04360 [Alphaproteobacteria bacterium]|nr:hypothetical protein [Alphaproteobacteria bacterium]